MLNKPLSVAVETWNNSPFSSPEKRVEVYQWFLHNIIFGFAGVWVPFLALLFFGYWRTQEALLDGEFVMFAVTLSAVSLGFFVKETQINLKKQAMLTYAALMLTMLVGVITRTALAFASKFSAVQLQMPIVIWVTIALVVLAILLNFRLFTLELAFNNRRAVEEKINEAAKELAAQAKENTRVDNIAL